MALKIPIQKTAEVKTPHYAHKGDAGVDIYSAEDCEIAPSESRVVSTGLKFEIPEGYVGLIYDKSGLASRHSVHNMAGVIDSSYRGEVKIVMMNLGKEPFKISKGIKIAQMIFHQIPEAEFIEAKELKETKRGEKGFGSTGLH